MPPHFRLMHSLNAYRFALYTILRYMLALPPHPSDFVYGLLSFVSFLLQACRALTASLVGCQGTGPEPAASTTSTAPCTSRDTDSETSRLEPQSGEIGAPSHCPIDPSFPRHPLQLPCSPRTPKAHPSHNSVTEKFADIIQVPCEADCQDLISDKVNVKGRLKSHSEFWYHINSPDMIMSIINDGLMIWFSEEPPSFYLSNNASAFHHYEFVTDSVIELLNTNRIVEIDSPAYVTSPLSVACQSSNKKRLILDLSALNKFVQKHHFKFEDWKVALQYFEPGALLFSFDLKSGYHHVEIHPRYQKYLGFSWRIDGIHRYFKFTVLPFGLSSAPLFFTKLMKPLVTHWRSCGIRIVLYLYNQCLCYTY